MDVQSNVFLLVEDNEDDVFLMKRALKLAGLECRLSVAEDGLQALNYLRGEGPYSDRNQYPLPQLVFLDLKLPYHPGLEILQFIREQPELQTLLVLVLTSSREPSDIDRAYRLGANSYLVKPTSFEQLVTLLDSVKRYWVRQNISPNEQSSETLTA
jgi:CheY-like chemotaxis protein